MKLLSASVLAAVANAASLRNQHQAMDLMKLNVEDMAKMPGDELENTLLGMLEEGTQNTPALAAFVRNVQNLVNNMEESVKDNRDRVIQPDLDRITAPFGLCTAARSTASAGVAKLQDVSDRQIAQKKACDATAKKLQGEADACDARLKLEVQVAKELCQKVTDLERVVPSCASVAGESLGNYSSRLTAMFADREKVYNAAAAACKAAKAKIGSVPGLILLQTTGALPLAQECAQKRAAATKQADLCFTIPTKTRCDVLASQRSMCTSFDSCYDQALEGFKKRIRSFRIQEEGLRTEYESIQRLKCLLSVFAADDEERGSRIRACRASEPNTNRMALRYPSAPEQRECRTPSRSSIEDCYDAGTCATFTCPAGTLAKRNPRSIFVVGSSTCCDQTTTTTTTTSTTTTTTGPLVTCSMTMDNVIDGVVYRDQDITRQVAGALGDWPSAKSFSFRYTPGAVLVVSGYDVGPGPDGQCAWSGFSITCNGPAAGVTNPGRWNVAASNSPFPAGDARRSGGGSGWTAVDRSTSPYYLAGQNSYSKMWKCGQKYAIFRYTM